ncbi:AAC(3) family N-acetyltransferase [Chlorogloeopsis sp. ULAP01]|uniref:aminoglycoside N(3)-acetyltransferase n=1 Tax=Chlorogloeopsis sp. ULAP01 TaxID=3056483 RepID=UPI0025AB57A8|nr:AAC(3) family N-acetyltransferase [Chlorogloeopsis sp. ULAP01]MDM9381382.1 AAC(3) family N-acetyltransferase [Chlorogloeopsis sp. ULAP01]
MSELEIILSTPSPRTRASLLRDLRQLGLAEGMTVMVHSSLSSLGWVCGGAVTVTEALMDVVTTTGTLVMPTHSASYSDPANWQAPPVPAEWWPIIRETMPAFDPQVTPTRGMSEIVEVFRTWPDVLRSSHPAVSFAAWGQHAKAMIADHSLNDSLGEGSPLARLYDLNGWVLLLGVGYDSSTCFHLAEYRINRAKRVTKGAAILEAGQRVWKLYTDIEFEDDCFVEMGTAFEQAGHVKVSKVGSATARLFPVRSAVDFAKNWLTNQTTVSLTPEEAFP